MEEKTKFWIGISILIFICCVLFFVIDDLSNQIDFYKEENILQITSILVLSDYSQFCTNIITDNFDGNKIVISGEQLMAYSDYIDKTLATIRKIEVEANNFYNR